MENCKGDSKMPIDDEDLMKIILRDANDCTIYSKEIDNLTKILASGPTFIDDDRIDLLEQKIERYLANFKDLKHWYKCLELRRFQRECWNISKFPPMSRGT